MRKCTNSKCNVTVNNNDANFCPKCGTKLVQSAVSKAGSDWVDVTGNLLTESYNSTAEFVTEDVATSISEAYEATSSWISRKWNA